MPGKVHADDIPVPVQEPGSGKTRTARLWVYVRDDHNAGSQMPPAVWFAYSPDRKGIHPQNHLAGYSGVLQADAYGGYRSGKSAHEALKQCTIRCWRYSWILEVDISAFFDHVRHDLVLKALEHHGMPKWGILFCRRWMEAPMQSGENGELITRTRGTPQGGVISPLLANLFLHYAFDLWMEREYRGYRLRGTLMIL